LGVLLGLEKTHNKNLHGNMLEEVDYFSSASGGGFAIGFYLSRLWLYLQQYKDYTLYPHFSFKHVINQLFQKNSATKKGDAAPLADETTINANLNSVISFFHDNADDYETAINNSVLYNPNHVFTLGDVFIPKNSKTNEARLPLWVANASIYQNMTLFPITPRVLAQYYVREFHHLGQEHRLKGNPASPDYGLEFPYSLALAASASYPIAFSSVTLGSDNCKGPCYVQLLDGGLTDNLGIRSAFAMLNEDPAKLKVLIIIDATSKNESAYSHNKKSPSGLSLLWQLLNSTVASPEQLDEIHAGFIVKGLLCNIGATNVLIAYLRLDTIKNRKEIPTNLHLTLDQQKWLIKAGESLVKHSKVLQVELPALLAGNKKVGQCRH